MIEGHPLATVEELQSRLAYTMTEDDKREAAGALESLSDDARSYGRSSWTEEANTPGSVKRLVLKAAARYMKNYEGYVQSRAGDETLGWTDLGEAAGSPYFTDEERAALGSFSGASALYTAPVVAWGTSLHRDYRTDWPKSPTGPNRWPVVPVEGE